MRWRRLGLVWGADGSLPWARSHATCPVPVRVRDGELRVFVQSRDAQGVGRVGYVDVALAEPTRVLRASTMPVLDIGQPGRFDDHGVMQTSLLFHSGRLWMYYVGFELLRDAPYRLLTGLAVSTDGGESFSRVQTGPVLARSDSESLFRCGTWVIESSGGFRTWYVAGSTWTEVSGRQVPVYAIHTADSTDGLQWPARGETCLSPDPAAEHGFGRPCVVPLRDGLEMYFSARRSDTGQQRLGYATSVDGIHWIRSDATLELTGAPAAWESQSTEFPALTATPAGTYLFYNGNAFGADGFGVAVREE